METDKSIGYGDVARKINNISAVLTFVRGNAPPTKEELRVLSEAVSVLQDSIVEVENVVYGAEQPELSLAPAARDDPGYAEESYL